MYGCRLLHQTSELCAIPLPILVLLACAVLLSSCLTQALPVESPAREELGSSHHSIPDQRNHHHLPQPPPEVAASNRRSPTLDLDLDSLRAAGASRTVSLRNECSKKLVQITQPGGRGGDRQRNNGGAVDVNAMGSGSLYRAPSQYALLQMKSTRKGVGHVTIMSIATNEYLCFNRKGRLITRTTPRSSCIFLEQQTLDERGRSLFQYSLEVGKSVNGTRLRFYLGFRKYGKRLRGDQWELSSKYLSCTYFHKEQDHLVNLGLPTQDPYAPIVYPNKFPLQQDNTDSQSKENGGGDTSQVEHRHRHNHKAEAPNPNRHWAPSLGNDEHLWAVFDENTGGQNSHRERHRSHITT